MNDQSPCVVWRFVDGKRGHENQTRGLVNALEELVSSGHPVSVLDCKPLPAWRAWLSLLTGRCPGKFRKLSRPGLVIGAGHRVHLSMLAARRCLGVPTVVLMKPSYPLRWFDLAIVPEHDDVGSVPNCIQTLGVLNTVKPSAAKQADRGLILVGGPSKHHGWDTEALISQISEIISNSNINWTLSNSRRTPAGFMNALQQAGLPRLDLIDVDTVDADWLPAQLDQAAQVWITEDSVSMVYEALTSGAACGLLEMPPEHSGRVQRGIERLVEKGWLVRFTHWQESDKTLKMPPQPLYEAGRVAPEVFELCQTGN